MSSALGFRLLLLHLKRFSWRHGLRAPATTIALLVIVALGVAVFFSVRLSSRAAVSGFQLFTQSISGGSDFVVTGAGRGIPVQRLPELRSALNPLPVLLFPVVEGTATLPGTGQAADDFDAAQVPVIGMDLFAVRNLVYARSTAQYSLFDDEPSGETEWGGAGEIFITRALATRLDVALGDTVTAILGDQPRMLRVAAVLQPSEFQAGKAEELMIMDLPALQGLLDQPLQVDRVEVIVPEGVRSDVLRNQTVERLGQLDPARWSWSTTDAQRESAQSMTAAFQLNLTILSGLSLLVGIYLIIQAMEAAVIRRRSEIGILLSMGYEPRWIRQAWLVESLVLGVVGSALGLAVGWVLAQGAVRGVAQTVNALYVSTTARAAAWDSGEALLAFGLGVTATVAAGLLPARDAAATPPVQVMRQEGRGGGIRLLDSPRLGLALIGAGVLAAQLPPLVLGPGVRFPLGGYLAALCGLVGAAVLSSNLLYLIPRLSRRAMERSALWRVAASQCRRPSGRQKLTIAGLVVAVGMAAGMEILTHSFERTVSNWIHRSLQADLFVAVKGIENASSRNAISEASWRKLAIDPDVTQVDIGHIFPILFQGAPTTLMGIRSTGPWSDEHLIWAAEPTEPVVLKDSLAEGIWPALASESFATRYRLGRGNELQLPTPTGERRVRILGVYADYGNERGTLLMDGVRVSEWFDDLRAINLAATLRPGVDPAAVRERWAADFPGLAVRTNRTLREEVLIIFHQTFAVTHALKAIGVAVAVGGLALALFSLLLDRREELVVLRELGFQRRGIMAVVTLEGLALSVIGLAGGLILSLGLGYLLIYVINKQSFGWTLAYAVPAGGLAVLAGGVLLAATLTSLGVGRWAARLKGEKHE
jgi:putative ABC transport system permease protein